MSALFQENIDGTYSLHFQEAELEVLTILLCNVALGNTGHPKAASELLQAIENGIGSVGVDNIVDAVPFEVQYDDDNGMSLKIGE